MNDPQGERPFPYITPFLDEVDRIVKACPEREFVQPKVNQKDGIKFNKSASLQQLAIEGRNIASTHKLFSLMNEDTLEAFGANDYVLIMDEVMQVIEMVDKPRKKSGGLV